MTGKYVTLEIKSLRKKTIIKKTKDGVQSWSTLSSRVTMEILRGMEFTDKDIQEALQACGPRVQACVEFCLSSTRGEYFLADTDEEASASDALRSLGYSLEECTRALELCDFSFTSAIKLLLFGSDTDRTQSLAKTHFRKHCRKVAKKFDPSLTFASVREQYAGRVLADLVLETRVVDFGLHAGDTTHACLAMPCSWACCLQLVSG